MGSLVYIRLIGFTAGTLLGLFWMVVILGYRRQRNFERVFFFLCLALFLFYSGSLLALNAQIHYAAPPPILSVFAATLLCAGLCFLPPLLIHLHFEYADAVGMLRHQVLKRLVLLAAYAPVVYFVLRVYPLAVNSAGFTFLIPGNALGRGYGAWLATGMLVSGAWDVRFIRTAGDKPQRRFYVMLGAIFLASAGLTLYLHVLGGPLSTNLSESLGTGLSLVAIVPLAALIYLVLRFNFLQIGRQKNLVYAVSATFLALLYLSLVRRLSGWLEPVLPPEATASILLFVLVIFFEPIQRVLGRSLRATAQKEMDRVQRLLAEIQHEARQGNVEALAKFVERRVKETFDFAGVSVRFWKGREISEERRNFAKEAGVWPLARGKPTVAFSEGKIGAAFVIGGNLVGVVRAEPHGAVISGETRAALEFLCEQLPGALDLCRLIEEKLRLERELAERERLALVGQMAASISHNLKNPLGSIKTILQVQMENPELPERLRGETKIVLDEIARLSAKLNQLLQFSRPSAQTRTRTSCDARAVIEEVAGVLKHEAERRGVALEVQAGGTAKAGAAADAVNDIVSNLVVNALEATSRGGTIRVAAALNNGNCVLSVEDDGPGIAPEARGKMLRPFFTTKTQGTGLGLAIVARRVAESGGKLEWESPTRGGKGTRFEVRLPGEGGKERQES